MPAGSKVAKVEAILKSAARKRGLSGDRFDRYVFGALNHMGMMRGNKPTRRGMQAAKRK